LASSIEKYKDIIHLMENRQYESLFILFRSLYENLIISYFLNYKNCVNELDDFFIEYLMKLANFLTMIVLQND
jgi:hypothetical protein